MGKFKVKIAKILDRISHTINRISFEYLLYLGITK